MAKAAKAKAKRSPKPKFTDKEQTARFIEAARQFGIEIAGQEFENAVDKILHIKPNKE
ncbi:MAG: hypothetical protein L0Y57_03755 [Beijerinckiaceae bacterium]|nr:hypothetical protein [Beijerinckiaceae bacterium]